MIETANPPAMDINRGNILIVDDEPDIIEVIQLTLEDQPANFYSAINGREAFQKLALYPIDVLLLDARLPDVSGFEICRIVKTTPHWQHIKVIMVSANANFDDKVRAYEFGADDYIIKPFRNREFEARIQVMLNLSLAERKLTRRNEQLMEIIKVFHLISSRPDLKIMADAIVQAACNVTKADRGFLLLWDEKRRGHRFIGWLNPAIDVQNSFLAEGQGLPGRVREQGTSVKISNYNEFDARLPNLPIDTAYAGMGVPLKIGQRQIGALTVFITTPDRNFTNSDEDMLTVLADRIASSIEKAHLYVDLSRSEEKYRLIAEKASDLIIALDRNGNLTYVNERSRSLLNYEPGEMIGRSLSDFLTDEGRNTIQQIYHQYFSTFDITYDHIEPHELVVLTKQAEPLNLEFNFGLLFHEEEIVGFQAIGRDVTSRKQFDETERMRLLGQMASGVAHDFNNVLANILGHAQLLAQETNDHQVRSVLQIIEQSARDGAETVRRIQEFNNQHTQPDMEVLDLNHVVQSSLDLSRPRWRDLAQAKGIQVEIERQFGAIKKVLANAANLREALINLINNAVDAMSDKGGKLGFRTYMSNNTVCLDVYDTGPGMPPEVRRHIFEPYYTTKGELGTGLGLSITYGIISRFGGQIICESNLGIGTTFTISLPSVSGEKATKQRKIQPASSSNKPTPRYKGRILAVDDEANIRNILKRALEINGFEVDVASSGAEAIEKIENKAQDNPDLPYQLVFSDLGMPGIGGWEVAAVVKQHWVAMPVVLVTGWGDQLDPAKLEQVGVKYTIAKPFNINDLVAMAVRLIPQD